MTDKAKETTTREGRQIDDVEREERQMMSIETLTTVFFFKLILSSFFFVVERDHEVLTSSHIQDQASKQG